jgi:FixJ family two-component response regulator
MPRHEQPLVLIVDDDGAVRAALEELLCSVGIETRSYASARELLVAEPEDRPGCLILDVRLPGGSGLELQHRLVSARDAKPIVFLTGHGDIPMSVEAMKAGAVDFLTKPVRDQTLLDAVSTGIARDRARRAERHVSDQLLERHASLTPREREVFRHVAQGRLNKQVAYDLTISEVTVKLHRGNVMRKMETATIGELIRAWEIIAPHLPTA